mmetsp:Transcript_67257/g.158643  ORF Transcript_67257/g.158643 Transcript_67257/m.158643 type:complete len:84 (-) Transcript_67257:170-421(-)
MDLLASMADLLNLTHKLHGRSLDGQSLVGALRSDTTTREAQLAPQTPPPPCGPPLLGVLFAGLPPDLDCVVTVSCRCDCVVSW